MSSQSVSSVIDLIPVQLNVSDLEKVFVKKPVPVDLETLRDLYNRGLKDLRVEEQRDFPMFQELFFSYLEEDRQMFTELKPLIEEFYCGQKVEDLISNQSNKYIVFT